MTPAWVATTVLAVSLAVFGRIGWWAALPLTLAFVAVLARRLVALRRTGGAPLHRDGPMYGDTFFLTVTLSAIFSVLAFSDDFAEAACEAAGVFETACTNRYIWIDVTLLGAIAIWMLLRRGRQAWRPSWRAYFMGAASTIALDRVDIHWGLRDGPPWDDVVVNIGWLVALTAIVAGVVGLVLPAEGQEFQSRASWNRFTAVTPIFFGTALAYGYGTLWDIHLRVDQEFFAQASQIILLLTIAVGLEGRFLGTWDRRGHADQATMLVALVILIVGEILSLSALIPPNPSSWHSFVAFTVATDAFAVALAYLVWSLALGFRDRSHASSDSAS